MRHSPGFQSWQYGLILRKNIYIYKLKHMAFFKDIKCINGIDSLPSQPRFIIHKLNVISEAL